MGTVSLHDSQRKGSYSGTAYGLLKLHKSKNLMSSKPGEGVVNSKKLQHKLDFKMLRPFLGSYFPI